MNEGFRILVVDSASTAPLGGNRPCREARQADRRGGVWSIGEVLAELLPRYASLAPRGAELAAFPRVIADWHPSEAELVSV
ncbi:MAG TPA: hypothetical protein VN699_17145 [Pirellulales bacterium]|nr:hypothetical protein [Pirellulales bacterium]